MESFHAPAAPPNGVGSVADVTAELRDQMSSLRVAERGALDVLDCIRRQQATIDRALACLSGQQAITDQLVQRVTALKIEVASLPDGLEPAAAQPEPPTEAAIEPEPPAPAAELPDEPEPALPAPAQSARPRRGVGRLLSRARRACAVCRRDATRAGKRELQRAGWTLAGHSGICPECSAEGWRLSDSGGLPFRHRSEVGT